MPIAHPYTRARMLISTEDLRKFIDKTWTPYVAGDTVAPGAERIYFKAGGSIGARRMGEIASLLWRDAGEHPVKYVGLVKAWILRNGSIHHVTT